MKNLKIDLSLLKKLVSEVEAGLAASNEIASAPVEAAEVPVDFVVALSKLSGLLASTAQEATLLVADVQKLIRLNSSPSPGPNPLEQLLKNLKDGEDPGDFGPNFN